MSGNTRPRSTNCKRDHFRAYIRARHRSTNLRFNTPSIAFDMYRLKLSSP